MSEDFQMSPDRAVERFVGLNKRPLGVTIL